MTTKSSGMTVEEAVEKPMVYLDPDGTPIYRASALGSCPNALLAARHGLDGRPPPAWLQARFGAGHDHEPLILAKLRERYNLPTYGHQSEVDIQVGSAKIRGHVDGLVDTELGNFDRIYWADGEDQMIPQGLAVVDAKALSQSSYDQWVRRQFDAYPHYLTQQAVYVYGLGFDGLVMAVKNKNTDDMTVDYFSKAWLQSACPKMKVFSRVLNVERQYERGPEALFDKPCGDDAMFPCPYFDYHPERKVEKPKGGGEEASLQSPDIAYLRELVLRREAAKSAADLAQSEKEECDAKIAAFFDGKKATAKLDEFTVSGYFSTHSGTDWEAIASAVGKSVEEVKAAYTKRTTSSKLSIKVATKRETVQ